jgi:hypothetical protein
MLQWNIASSEIASETSSGRRAAHRARVVAATAVADHSHAPAGAAVWKLVVDPDEEVRRDERDVDVWEPLGTNSVR